MKKKEYAPLIKTIEYKYMNANIDNSFRIHVVRDRDLNIYKAAVLCQKCGHIHIVKQTDTRHNRITRPYNKLIGHRFKCPKCGHIAKIGCEYTWGIPHMAKIFYMADGSIAISFTYYKHTLVLTKNDLPIYRKKLLRFRVIYSSNGQTYYKSPVYIDSGRSPKTHPKRMINITYANSLPCFNSYLAELQDNMFIDKEQNLMNRFRKVKLYRKEVYEFGKAVSEYRYSLENHVIRTMSGLKVEVTDEEVFNLALRRCNIKNGGKKFRRLLAKNPLKTYLISRVFHNSGMKDINSFYRLCEMYNNAPMIVIISRFRIETCSRSKAENDAFMMIRDQVLKVGGENNLVKIYTDDNKLSLLLDSGSYAYYIQGDITNEELKKNVVSNINTTHDNLGKVYHQLMRLHRMTKSAKDILDQYTMINANLLTDSNAVDIIKNRSIRNIEELTDNKIDYSDKERKLETIINDIKFILPPSTDYLINAGESLHNCVGDCYRMKAYRKQCIIVLMKKHSKLVGCIELTNGTIQQAFGPCNRKMDADADRAYQLWLKQNSLSKDKQNLQYKEFNLDHTYHLDTGKYAEKIQLLMNKTGLTAPEVDDTLIEKAKNMLLMVYEKKADNIDVPF